MELEKILHGTSLTEINNIDDGLLLIAPTALKATLRLRPKLHQIDLSLYLLQTCQCQCQCQSKFFSVAKIAELLRSPQRRSRVTIQNQEMIVEKEMF